MRKRKGTRADSLLQGFPPSRLTHGARMEQSPNLKWKHCEYHPSCSSLDCDTEGGSARAK